MKEYLEQNKNGFDYGKIDFLYPFKGSHPAVMQTKIKKQDWNFNYDSSKNDMSIKEKLLKTVQDVTGKQLFIYKNYKMI